MTKEKVIELVKVNKWYDEFHVLKDVDLSVYQGEKIIVCGPSGSGKSTLIRCIIDWKNTKRGWSRFGILFWTEIQKISKKFVEK